MMSKSGMASRSAQILHWGGVREIFAEKFFRAFVGQIRNRDDFDFRMLFQRRQMSRAHDAARSYNSDPQFMVIFWRHASHAIYRSSGIDGLLRETNLTAARILRSRF